ncbi:hypothetical protein D3C78_1731560 [compost metagenome]
MGFIHDHHVIFIPEQYLLMRVAFGGIYRSDNDIVVPGMLFFLGNGRYSKFLIQLANPLKD